MGEEWFKKDKDLKAALGEFLEELGKESLKGTFIRNARKAYKEGEKNILDSASPPIDASRFNDVTMHFFKRALIDTNRAITEKNEVKQAESLGNAWGYFMAGVDYGLTSEYFDANRNREDLLKIVEAIKSGLQVINRSVKHEHIRNRLNKILSKNKKLKVNQRRLIIEIAQIFAS